MAEGGSSDGSRNTMIIAVVALLLVAGIAFWAMSRRQPAEKRAGTTTSGSVTVGDKDVKVKVNLPDSVTINAH